MIALIGCGSAPDSIAFTFTGLANENNRIDTGNVDPFQITSWRNDPRRCRPPAGDWRGGR